MTTYRLAIAGTSTRENGTLETLVPKAVDLAKRGYGCTITRALPHRSIGADIHRLSGEIVCVPFGATEPDWFPLALRLFNLTSPNHRSNTP